MLVSLAAGLVLGLSQVLGVVADIPRDASFDISRIEDYPDKELLARISEYFIAFTTSNFDGMSDLEAEHFRITDIPLDIVRYDKHNWYQANAAFTLLMTDIRVQAISIAGSSKPGEFAIMENVVWFTLAVDPPEEAIDDLPPGMKKGDTEAMIMLSAIWWDEEGKVVKELEYGRVVWEDFNIDTFI